MTPKKLVAVGIAVAMLLIVMVLPAAAAPSDPLHLSASQCNPSGGPVLNITFKVTRDADSGTAGNVWAFDNYNKKVQVWQQADGTFCAIVKYEGRFVTVAGPSPQAATTNGTVGAGVTGAFEGGYTALFDGTLKPGLQTKGNIGTFDYACDTSSNCTYFDWVSAYFAGNTTFSQPSWAWTYHAGNNGTWVNASTGNLGDITGN
jgi:hypothetical protein